MDEIVGEKLNEMVQNGYVAINFNENYLKVFEYFDIHVTENMKGSAKWVKIGTLSFKKFSLKVCVA